MSINYKRISKGTYTVTLNEVKYFVCHLMSGNWTLFTLDRATSLILNTKGQCTVWLYKNVVKM